MHNSILFCSKEPCLIKFQATKSTTTTQPGNGIPEYLNAVMKTYIHTMSCT